MNGQGRGDCVASGTRRGKKRFYEAPDELGVFFFSYREVDFGHSC